MSLNQPGYSTRALADATLSTQTARFMSQVYSWMMVAIIITGITSYQISQSFNLIQYIFSHQFIFIGLIILQLVAVGTLSLAISKLNTVLATLIYLVYSVLTGTTLSVVFLAYAKSDITLAFGVTAIAFGGLSVLGYITKKDLSPIGSFCYMGLFGIIGLSLLAFFIPSLRSDTIQLAISAAGVIVFSGLTAYDTQKIKQMRLATAIGSQRKLALLGALTLYLDFINLFLFILRLIGGRRR